MSFENIIILLLTASNIVFIFLCTIKDAKITELNASKVKLIVEVNHLKEEQDKIFQAIKNKL